MTQSTTATNAITATPAGTPEQLTGEKMLMDNVLMLGMLFAIFYFILIRPQQKRLKSHKDMLGSLEKGNRVITQGGLIGVITKFEGDNVAVIEVAQGVKVRVAKHAISEVTKDTPSSESANDN